MGLSAECKQGRTIIARLKTGDMLPEAIHAILEKHKIKAGYMPLIVGGFKNLRLKSMKKAESEDMPATVETEFKEPLEYFGMGTIARDTEGKPSVHVHLSAAKGGCTPVLGHLVSGKVVLLTEIVIVEITSPKIVRKIDSESCGYDMINFE